MLKIGTFWQLLSSHLSCFTQKYQNHGTRIQYQAKRTKICWKIRHQILWILLRFRFCWSPSFVWRIYVSTWHAWWNVSVDCSDPICCSNVNLTATSIYEGCIIWPVSSSTTSFHHPSHHPSSSNTSYHITHSSFSHPQENATMVYTLLVQQVPMPISSTVGMNPRMRCPVECVFM